MDQTALAQRRVCDQALPHDRDFVDRHAVNGQEVALAQKRVHLDAFDSLRLPLGYDQPVEHHEQLPLVLFELGPQVHAATVLDRHRVQIEALTQQSELFGRGRFHIHPQPFVGLGGSDGGLAFHPERRRTVPQDERPQHPAQLSSENRRKIAAKIPGLSRG
jgi:hypothetical protein